MGGWVKNGHFQHDIFMQWPLCVIGHLVIWAPLWLRTVTFDSVCVCVSVVIMLRMSVIDLWNSCKATFPSASAVLWRYRNCPIKYYYYYYYYVVSASNELLTLMSS